MGMSAPGEIRLLAKLAAPDVGVVTNVGAVHLEFFPDVEAIARAKFELIETLGPDAWAVLNADDPRVRAFGDKIPGRVLSFGISQLAQFRARDLEPIQWEARTSLSRRKRTNAFPPVWSAR